MYNRLYSHLTERNLLDNKQFGFQQKCSTDPIDELCDSFDKKLYTIGVFVDLAKASDTVDHNILLTEN